MLVLPSMDGVCAIEIALNIPTASLLYELTSYVLFILPMWMLCSKGRSKYGSAVSFPQWTQG